MKVVGNSTRVYENFNGVSDKLKEELIKPVKPGELVHFQLLNGSYDPSSKRECFGASRSLRLSDRIFDPYASEKKNGKGEAEYIGAYVEVGVPDTIREGRVERCKKFWVESIANGIPGNGQFDLMGGDISQMEVYEFLCLSNGNKNNPYRDVSKAPEYEVVDTGSVIRAQKEKDQKELQSKLSRFAKENPEAAAELVAKAGVKKAKEQMPV